MLQIFIENPTLCLPWVRHWETRDKQSELTLWLSNTEVYSFEYIYISKYMSSTVGEKTIVNSVSPSSESLRFIPFALIHILQCGPGLYQAYVMTDLSFVLCLPSLVTLLTAPGLIIFRDDLLTLWYIKKSRDGKDQHL